MPRDGRDIQPMRVAVVGHVEWTQFARVDTLPEAGQIVSAVDAWEQAAGGGAVAAVQIARLAGECLFLTALGDDALGNRAKRDLEAMGLRVEAAWRPAAQRRAFVQLDRDGERTITTMGSREGPRAHDPLPWDELEDVDAVYVTAGDARAIRAARTSERLVATIRAGEALAESEVQVDVLLSSATDEAEAYRRGDLDPEPRWVARSEGAAGGSLEAADGTRSRWAPAPPPGPLVDSHGAGDSLAGGLTYGLARGLSLEQAFAVGARCGAAAAAGRGPYEGQLSELEIAYPRGRGALS
jgi:ribokinase